MIFILDDSEDERWLIENRLKERGLENFKSFAKADKLLNELKDSTVIALLDYKLNGINGIDVARKIKEKNPYCYFILFSGMMDYEMAFQFNWEFIRSRFISKNQKDAYGLAASCVIDFYKDIRLMRDTYADISDLLKGIDASINKALK